MYNYDVTNGGESIGTTLFNLIAVLFSKTLELSNSERKTPISKEMSDTYENIARSILINIFQGDKMFINTQNFADIINSCEKYNDLIVYRCVLCQLDLLVDINEVIKAYDYNKVYNGTLSKSFDSLNTNASETGITIIPKVTSLTNTIYVKKDNEVVDKNYTDGNYWYDNLNEHFNNIICIKNTALNGYTIKNVIVDLFKDRNREKIVIGVTPCCNAKLDEIMDVVMYCSKETGEQHFCIKEYYDSKRLTERFINVASKAKSNNVDILIGPEMLGALELCETDDLGFNQNFRNVTDELPYLTVTPSVWVDGKNYLSVYLKSGEQIGKQYKQNSFEFSDSGERFEEDLKNIPREILLIHVPGWGRVVFPICVDFLVATYRDLLARELKATLMLCPSYSSGTVQFGNASGSVKDFGTRFVWINSCSALRKFTDKPEVIGLVSVPVTSPDNVVSNAIPIKPQCNGMCRNDCLFTITIQAISNGSHHCNEVEIKHVPLF